MQAYAVAITPNNILGVIQSEAGRDFDVESAFRWLQEHEEGWFLRDEGSPLDCHFFVSEVFAEMYAFTAHDESALFRHVVKL